MHYLQLRCLRALGSRELFPVNLAVLVLVLLLPQALRRFIHVLLLEERSELLSVDATVAVGVDLGEDVGLLLGSSCLL